MKAKMEEAAKGLDKLAQRLLPERPHHLTAFDEIRRRYPNPSGFWFTGASGPLQYMTYVCDANRGVLLTRPRYELCDEPEAPSTPIPLKAPNKGDVVKKKIALQDYQKRKKSISPADNEGVTKMEHKQNGVAEARLNRENGEKSKKEATKHRETSGLRQEVRPEKLQQNSNGNRQKPDRKQEIHAPPTESRKRPADHDESAYAQKRPRADISTSRISASKPETPKTRERTHEKEKIGPKDSSKGGSLHPLLNGHLEQDRDREQTASPKSTIQVNGSTPRKTETSSRLHVPDLLSPLHPSFERELTERDRQKKRLPEKAPTRSAKTDAQSPAKKHKTSIKIPELLSPTLPPVVELELARLKKTPSKGESSRSSQASDSPSSARKPRIVIGPLEEEEEQPMRRPSRIVTLKLKKANAKRAKELLSLPSKSAMEALKKERSMSVEGTPPPARKRPRPPEDETVGNKKKRSDSTTARPIAPSTPLKHGSTAMSRVTSSQSQGNTPGAGLTPGTAERPPTSSKDKDADADQAQTRAQISAWKEIFESHQGLGRTLKHSRDNLLKTRGSAITAAEEKRAAALHFEMILAYMLSFSSFNKARTAERKVLDIERWESLLPHLRELRGRVRHSRPLSALAIQMNALCLEQISLAFISYDPEQGGKLLRRWRELERSRTPTWAEAMSHHRAVEVKDMKVLIGPWTSVENAVSDALAIMGRWADRDSVNWRATIHQKAATNGVKG